MDGSGAEHDPQAATRAGWFAEASGRPLPGDVAPVSRALNRAYVEAASGWPSLAVDERTFVRHVAACLARDERVWTEAGACLERGAVPDALQIEDLYLASACARGDSAAIAAFERRYDRQLGAIVAQFAGKGRAPEDLRQILRERLFVAHDQRPPRIVEYRGTGTLKAWLKVTAVRAFLDERRRVSRREQEDVSPGEALLDMPAEQDWELDFLKRRYREAFRHAFWQALTTLTSEQRNLLRYHAVEGLTLDQIAAITPIHRSSIARRLQKARQALLTATREALATSLRVEGREFESIMALIQSRLDVSLSRVLAPTQVTPPGPPEGEA